MTHYHFLMVMILENLWTRGHLLTLISTDYQVKFIMIKSKEFRQREE